MANYNLTINSKFQPFSFERYLQPYQIYGQAYSDMENQYTELITKANVWDKIADSQTDPYAYQMYKTYSDDLEKQADQLAREGLTPANRQNILKMKQRYSSDIIPIEQAYERRRELVDEQRKLLAQDDTLMFDKDASMLSLDDLIKNPNLTYQSRSGAKLIKQVGAAVQNLAKEMRDNPGKWRNILGNQYFETIMQKGYKPEEIIQVLQKDSNTSSILEGIVEDVVDSSNISSWRNQDILDRAYGYARQGLWNAVGETQYQIQTNKGYDYAMRDWLAQQEFDRNQNRPTTKKTSSFAPRVFEGAQGEVSKELKILDGLRVTPDGYSTTNLDRLKAKIDKAQKIYNDAEKGVNKSEVSAYESSVQRMQKQAGNSSYLQMGASMTANLSVPQGYNKYKITKDNLQKAKAAYQEELNKIAELEKKYAHLGNTAYKRLSTGLELDTIQQKQESSSFALNSKESDYNNIREGVANVLRAISEDNIEAGTVGLVNSKGKPVSYPDLQDILKNSKEIAFKVKGGNNTEFKLVYKGKEYSIKGIEQLDKFNKDLKVANDYLKDFSSKITDSITPISYDTYNEIIKKGVSNVNIGNVNDKPVEGTNYTGTVLYNADTQDYIKVLMDKNKNVVATNRLSSELTGGTQRDSYFIDMANTGLEKLQELFARED